MWPMAGLQQQSTSGESDYIFHDTGDQKTGAGHRLHCSTRQHESSFTELCHVHSFEARGGLQNHVVLSGVESEHAWCRQVDATQNIKLLYRSVTAFHMPFVPRSTLRARGMRLFCLRPSAALTEVKPNVHIRCVNLCIHAQKCELQVGFFIANLQFV